MMQTESEVKTANTGGGIVSSLLDCYERIVARAFLIAEKDKAKITDENAEGYFMAAIAQEDKMISGLLETAKGQDALALVINNANRRVYSKINQCDGCRRGLPVENGVHIGDGVNDKICCTKHLYS